MHNLPPSVTLKGQETKSFAGERNVPESGAGNNQHAVTRGKDFLLHSAARCICYRGGEKIRVGPILEN
jgi:hypothetical protein